jgi:threonine aldolase
MYNNAMVYEMFPASNNPEAQFIGFASDNYAPAHPSVLEWLDKANQDFARPYNDDPYTKQFRSLANEIFGKEVAVFPSLNGTGANVLSLRAVLPRWGTVCSPETAHINTDEAGAPEHMAGLKIMTSPTLNGKMTPQDIVNISRALGDIHSAQPAIVSVSNTTERGTFYTAEELGELAQEAHSRGMLIHVDGARIFNAIVSAGYTSLAEGFSATYGETGIDVISLGGTKVGAISAEAVVVLHPENSNLSKGAKFSQKQMGQLASKARYCSAQFLALFENDLAYKLAYHSNQKMLELFEKFLEVTKAKQANAEYLSGATSAYASADILPKPSLAKGGSSDYKVEYEFKPDANAFFPTLPNAVVTSLREKYHFYDINPGSLKTTIRLMTSWKTTAEEVEGFISSLEKTLI